jgi:hypothetical protein
MIKRLRSFLARRAPKVFRRRQFSVVHIVERVSDVPDDTNTTIFLVQRSGIFQWAVFDCPCCSGHRITVTLRQSDSPHWTVTLSGKQASLHPSLWFHEGCQSHFWIKNNHVNWV